MHFNNTSIGRRGANFAKHLCKDNLKRYLGIWQNKIERK